jgi:hypothetical protein
MIKVGLLGCGTSAAASSRPALRQRTSRLASRAIDITRAVRDPNKERVPDLDARA